jgi:hypothetical protein
MGHATFAVLVGGTSMASLSSLLTGCGFEVGRVVVVQSSLSTATPGRITKGGDGPSVQDEEHRDQARPGGGTFDFAGGILDGKYQNENTVGALSLTRNSTLGLHAGGGKASPGFATASTTGATLPINAWSDPADTSRPDGNTFITTGAATSGALGQIEFTSDAPGVAGLGRQIVPVPEPTTVALAVFGAVVVMFGIGRRLYARANNKSGDRSEAVAGPSFSTERSGTGPSAENKNLR